jgi:hypothetical protein
MGKPVFVITVTFPAGRGTLFAGNWSFVAFDMSSSVNTYGQSGRNDTDTSKMEDRLTDMFDIPCGIVV